MSEAPAGVGFEKKGVWTDEIFWDVWLRFKVDVDHLIFWVSPTVKILFTARDRKGVKVKPVEGGAHQARVVYFLGLGFVFGPTGQIGLKLEVRVKPG